MTFQLQGNYGAILQNFALQQYLKSYGHRPETIQWETEFNSWKGYFRTIYYLLKDWSKSKYHVLPTLPGKFRVYAENGGRHRFVKKYIKLSKTCLIENLHELVIKSGYDVLIVGSDQVWRPSFIKDIENMFLSFANGLPVKRIAYAASFGVDYNDFSYVQLQKCGKLLHKFDSVSVREYTALQQCKEYFQYDKAEWMPDPTFLIERNIYDKHCCKIPKKSNILFAYILDEDAKKLAYIKELALNNNLTVVIKYEKGTPNDTVEEWLALFRDATYIVTDSFHGTVFSLIYHKNFTLFKNQYRGNIRLESLFRQMNLDKYCTESDISYSLTPNWGDVETRIKYWREIGHSFLSSGLRL